MIKGKIHKFGANIDTDAIIPSRFFFQAEYSTSTPRIDFNHESHSQ